MKKISIIGLGFVGLPLACILAQKKVNQSYKYKVIGIDKKFDTTFFTKKDFLENFKKNLADKKLISTIKQAEKNKNFYFSSDYKNIKGSSVVVISIGFDFISKNVSTSFKSLEKIFKNISSNINQNTLLIMETTVPPGTSEKIIIPTIQKIFKKRKMSTNKIYYAYSYERVMPGKNYYNSIVNMNRCFAGRNSDSSTKCKKFLKKFINTKKYPLYELENLRDCETSKIMENSYRAMNIAFIDEWTVYANKIKVNLNKVIEGIKVRKTHNNIMRPGLGVGGYCLTKDPTFAAISSKHLFKSYTKFPLSTKSVFINRSMTRSSLNFINRFLPNKKKLNILILGASYRQDIGDIRNSPSIEISKKLKRRGHNVLIHDPVILTEDKKNIITNKMPDINKFDVVLFCVGHAFYKSLRISKLPKRPYYFDLNLILKERSKVFLRENNYKLKVLGDD